MIENLEITIWDRHFSLRVDYDCYAGETVLPEQINAMQQFCAHADWVAIAKGKVESYCEAIVQEDSENDKKDNIFSYIKPDGIFVKREKSPRVAIMCKYRYDMEHGVAVVFAADGSVTVGPQDIIL